MNTIKTIVAMISLNTILSSSGCYRYDGSSDDKLTLEKVDYNGNELRIDGYYYRYSYVGKEQKLDGVIPFFCIKTVSF